MTAFVLRNPVRNLCAEINITPLVDVMLVLLVIFILAAPLTTRKLALITRRPAPRARSRRIRFASRSSAAASCTGTGSRSAGRRWR